MKETVLRIIHSTTIKEPIHAMSRRQSECVFHCSIPVTETLLQEEINCGQVISLRVRQLSNPPPEVNLRDSYKTVTKLELSCPIEPSWVFSISSILPSLSIVRFGSSCFEMAFGNCPPLSQSWLTKSPSVKELIISFDHRKLLLEDFDKKRVIQTLNSILEHSTQYFVNLTKADLYLPSGVELVEFISNNPVLAATGDIQEVVKHGTVRFQSVSYKGKVKRPPQPMRADSTSSENDFSPQGHPMKRQRSNTVEFSSDDSSVSVSSRGKLYPPISPPFNNNYSESVPLNRHLPQVIPVPLPPAAIPNYPVLVSYRDEEPNGIKSPIRFDAPDPDFNQMFTRRRN